MSVQRGDVVLALFPFASGGKVKQRPVLVVQNDRDNKRLTNTIVIQITSNTARAHEPTHLFIESGTPEGIQSGLLSDSLISCVNLATIGADRIGRTIGSLPSLTMAKVDDCLRRALGL